MIKAATAKGGRLTESGLVQNNNDGTLTAYRGENVHVTVCDNGCFEVKESCLSKNYCFTLTWNISDVLKTDCFGYGVRAVDSDTNVAYFARPVFNERGELKQIRIDCIERMWFWLELDVFSDFVFSLINVLFFKMYYGQVCKE